MAKAKSLKLPEAVIVTLVAGGGEHAVMESITHARHARYAQRHDYSFLPMTEAVMSTTTGKLAAIAQVFDAMSDGATVVWLDTDAIIADMDYDFREVLPEWAWLGLTVHPITWSRDPFHIQCGVMYWRVTPQSRDFLKRIRTMQRADAPNDDQSPVNWSLMEKRDLQSGFCLLGHEFNANVHTGWVGMHDVTPKVAAFHGCPDRVERLLRYTAELEGAPITPAQINPATLDIRDRLNKAYVADAAGDTKEAEWHYRVILEHDPDQHEVARHYAAFLCKHGRRLDAVPILKYSLSKLTEDTGMLILLATCYFELGMHYEAGKLYDRTVATGNANETAFYRWCHGWYQLIMGNLKEGWEGFSWGYYCNTRRMRHPSPEWDGSYLGADKRLYLTVEMGYGDEIVFDRFVKAAKEVSGAWVIMECYEPLVPLLLPKTAADEVVVADRDRTFRCGFDVWCNMGTLPRVLGVDSLTELSKYSAPHLRDDSLPGAPEDEILRVGLSWRGSKIHLMDSMRSIAFAQFGAILKVDGVQFVSLQFQAQPSEFVSADAVGLNIETPDVSTADKLAAAIESCHVIISVDTFVANLAAAMGKNVWVMAFPQSDFRWGHPDSAKSPWYPSATVYRYHNYLGEWNSMTFAIANDLKTEVAWFNSKVINLAYADAKELIDGRISDELCTQH